MAIHICIVGCGALGSVIGAHLARLEGAEVHAYDVSEEHVSAIRNNGLRISGAADFSVRIHASTRASEIPACDFGILAVKSLRTRAAIERTAHLFGEGSAVCSVQNGLGNEEILADHVKNVIRGATTLAAHLRGAGHAAFEFYSQLWIGPFEPSGTPYTLVEKLAELMNRAGLKVVPLQDARGAQWTKLIFNSAANPVGALTRLHHGGATRFQPTADLYESLLREGEDVAQALGIHLYGDPRAMVVEGARSPEKRNASMLLDVLANRPTEVDAINGAIADCGERLGIPVPLNRAIWRLLKGLEHSWGEP